MTGRVGWIYWLQWWLALLGRGLRALAVTALAAGALIAAAIMIFYDADFYPMRDRYEHFKRAWFEPWHQTFELNGRRQLYSCAWRMKGSTRICRLQEIKRKVAASSPATSAPDNPGMKLHAQLQSLYAHFNKELYGGRLPPVVITLRRSKKFKRAAGYFHHRRFRRANGGAIDEIAIDAGVLGKLPVIKIAAILVHEMEHLRQALEGTPDKTGGHNAEFAEGMMATGLYPSSTGRPGGATTGPHMSHHIIPGGRFEIAAKKHPLMKEERLAFFE